MMHTRPRQVRSSRYSAGQIDVESSINSGQVFLWEHNGDLWYGIDGDHVVYVDATGTKPRIRSHVGHARDIFRQSDNMRKILSEISCDERVDLAVRRFPGMRLMRQDPFQCLITFITSANSSMPNIKNALSRLCVRYGKKVEFDRRTFSLFPKPEALANASAAGLASCSMGYRAKYVRQAAKMASTGRLDLEGLARVSYAHAMETLLDVPGVGNKVADCILLFALEKLDAFPLDRWMSRILGENYPQEGFGRMTNLTPKRYAALHDRIVKRFGRYAGYSQQFLFKAGREDASRSWAVNP